MAQTSTALVTPWHPELTYEFIVRIGDHDYSTDLVKLEIRSTINTPYQYFILDIFMDPKDILLNDVFGQQKIKLTIRSIGKTPENYANDLVFDLMSINVNADYKPMQQHTARDQKERTITTFKAICIKSYQTMSTMVNEIYFNKTPYDIISSLIEKYTDANLKYDSDGRSKLIIDQLLIPPTTIYNILKYLDKTYGIFNGPVAIHTSYDNKLLIQNLNTRLRQTQTFTLHLLATDKIENEAFNPKDPAKEFYSRKASNNAYKGNSVFTVQAPRVKYIVKPSNELSRIHDIDLNEFSKSYGVIEKNNPKVFYDNAVINSRRVSYDQSFTGYDKDQTFIQSTLSQNISDMSVTTAEIEGNLPILNLMSVGEHIKIKSQVDSYMKLGGSYILKGSLIQFMKATAWESFAKIYMSRTNVAAQ